ncbi:hypothetical protein EPUS_05557 [Endocarpon pusillum Z07020]|uniref:Copper acquisition factor BIM1-like domain-containing protein n=1 Tax=Endocarpon pusillum (strain Z07020 / HMAS-L-300199) TaxID=1263415 RepID=U1G8R5_ENDPU|nr:uncharacterized protein EPUS_05557 [Endocarpon pusillum Z07020]ERF73852.1 hypothetical protein EPUS_05557 [Endocarpon pusillum Z07020]
MLCHSLLVPFFAALVPVSAHFELNYPTVRGFNEDNLGTGPCGGFDTPTSERTSVSTTSLVLALRMGHDENAVQVLMGMGDNPGNNFNITLVSTFREEGLGEFCLPDIPLPSNLGIMDGMNATIQVVTNGDPAGGLYNCADITFTTGTVNPPSQCTNGTGVNASPFPSQAAARNANESTPQGQAQSGSTSETGSSSQSGSATGSSTAATSTPTGKAAAASVGWGLLGAVFLGAAALL